MDCDLLTMYVLYVLGSNHFLLMTLKMVTYVRNQLQTSNSVSKTGHNLWQITYLLTLALEKHYLNDVSCK